MELLRGLGVDYYSIVASLSFKTPYQREIISLRMSLLDKGKTTTTKRSTTIEEIIILTIKII